jgi:hypothetical protein
MTDKNRKKPEISTELLQTLSFELIANLTELWRKLDISSSPGKGRKFSWGSLLHRMIIDAMRYHPDIKRLKELAEYEDQVREEIANARKIHRITQ